MDQQNNISNTASVLVVEDEQALRGALHEKLKHAGFRVLLAENGQIGLSIALSQHPDVILLDIVMPVMDGLTMLDNLRKDEWGKGAKVIMLTNLTLNDERLNDVVKNQPTYYLVKNEITLEEILGKIKEVISYE